MASSKNGVDVGASVNDSDDWMTLRHSVTNGTQVSSPPSDQWMGEMPRRVLLMFTVIERTAAGGEWRRPGDQYEDVTRFFSFFLHLLPHWASPLKTPEEHWCHLLLSPGRSWNLPLCLHQDHVLKTSLEPDQSRAGNSCFSGIFWGSALASNWTFNTQTEKLICSLVRLPLQSSSTFIKWRKWLGVE